MGSASLPGLNSVGSIDRSMVEKIVRQIALEYFRKGNSEADAADASGEFPSDPISGQLSGNCASALNRPLQIQSCFSRLKPRRSRKKFALWDASSGCANM